MRAIPSIKGMFGYVACWNAYKQIARGMLWPTEKADLFTGAVAVTVLSAG